MSRTLQCNITTTPDGGRLIMVIVQPSVNVSNIYRVNVDKTNNQADNVFMQLETDLRADYLRYDFHVAHDIGEPMGF